MPINRRKINRYDAARASWGVLTALFMAVGAGGERVMGRPDPLGAKPQATCELQSVAPAQSTPAMREAVVFAGSAPVVDDPLANYARTPLGDWQMPNRVNREDPWLRFVLFALKRPVVIDVAVFVDGKPYANGREAWIDEVLSKKTPEPATPIPAASTPPAASEEKKEKKIIVPKADEPPKVSAQSRQAPSMRERLLAYVATSGPAVDRREIRWLIAEWGFGPPVVVLDPSLSWQRASVAPLVAYLDSDRSGALEAGEIAQADELLRRADADANDVVDEKELRRQSDEPPVLPFTADHSLVVPIDDATDTGALAADLARIYGLDAERVDSLVSGPADATLRVDFGASGSRPAGVALLAVGPEFAGSSSAVAATTDAITLDLGAAYIEFSAAAFGEGADVARTQIGVGAVIDGNPLVRLLDADQNHRLTLRERQRLTGLLATLDRDQDGQVAAGELPIPIRFAVTLGPQVHTLLAQPTWAKRTIAPRDVLAPPDWFASMDKNGDHDLSRGEFLGTAEQFGQFDADSDGLLSVAEALEMNSGGR